MSSSELKDESPKDKKSEEDKTEKHSTNAAVSQIEIDSNETTEEISKLNASSDAGCEMSKSTTEIVAKQETASNVEDDVTTVVAPHQRPVADNKSKQSLKWNFRVIISNLYMNSEQRLPAARVPKCLHNTSLCVSKHRCAMLPNAPDISIAQELRNNLYNKHYDSFLDMQEAMALQCVFPDEAVFDWLFSMLMILSSKTLAVQDLRSIYNNVIRIYYLLVDTFPPCWTALRPYYLDFLGVSDPSEPGTPQKLQLLLDLLAECLDKCSETELKELTKYYEESNGNIDDEEYANLSQDSFLMRHVQDYDWQGSKLWLDDFKQMAPSVRLARIFDALDMICWVLERQFMSWMDHNRMQQAEPEIFQDELKPFALIVFGMKPEMRLTKITRQLFLLYSRAVAKSLHTDRLAILERFVSLLMEASNTAELQYVENSLIYPSLGPQTSRLIAEFFKIFKMENPKHISTYIKTIPQFTQSYVRYEFTNHFLQLFYCSKAPFGPEKICEEFKSKQWLKYKARSAIESDDDEQLSREDYLKIMLNALQDYCSWLNLQPFWKYMKTKEPVKPLQTRTSSPLATPVGVVTGEVGKIFMLDEMQKEAHTWKQRINSKVIVAKPKVNLPVARISTLRMAGLFGGGIRQMRYLRRVLLEVTRYVDVTEWLKYLKEFLGEDNASVSDSSLASVASGSAAESDN
ncbi:uncharacterized protein LOC132791863 [Drosophila nasuta]|uniref:uncharacterized protein LOC132791863 n=1 Tax=Drosophila nasuta TaxID=42062 RepID=UPI00295F426F|nr:uncharacterized protein LOC132791863 [Drosophila nasuta]